MKKTLLTFFAIIFSTIFIFSCGGNQSPEIDINYNDYGVATLDFSGYVCDIVQSYPVEEPIKYRQDTLGADLVLKRISDIETELNCEINIVSKSSGYLEPLITLLMAGDYVGEIACSHQPSYLARAGVLYPLDALNEYIDYMDSAKYGSLGVLEQGMYMGVPYTVSPMLWLEKQATYSYNMFAFNTNLAKKYNISDPREYVENGEWYWDKFEEFVANSTIYDGEITIKSMQTMWSFVDNVAFSNGFEYTMISSSGTPISGVSSINLIEAIDWTRDLFANYRDNIESTSGYAESVTFFLSDKSFLYQTSFSHLIESIVYEMENFGVVPFPCGPRGVYGQYYGPMSDIDSLGIWFNAKEPEAAALIINKMYEPLDGYETFDDLLSQANSIFFDSRDTEYYLTYLGNTRWNYWTTGMSGHWRNLLNEALAGRSGVEAIEKFGQQMDNLIETYIMGNAEFIEEWKEQH